MGLVAAGGVCVMGPAVQAASALGLGAAAAVDATATPDKVRLLYVLGDGAGDCPTREVLHAAVAERLGYDPFEAAASGEASVSISAKGSRYTANVVLSGVARDGERRVEATVHGCDELIDALALAVSLALDPEAVERIKHPRRARDLTWVHRPRWGLAEGTPGGLSDLLKVDKGAVGGAAWWLTPRVGVGLGGTPSPTPDLRLALDHAPDGFRVGLELRADIPVPRPMSSGTVSAHLTGLTASGCFEVLWFRGCALATAGALVLHGRGFDNARSRVVGFGSAGGRLAASWPIDASMTVDVVADLEAPIVRAGIRVGDGIVWRAEAVSGSAAVGVGWRL